MAKCNKNIILERKAQRPRRTWVYLTPQRLPCPEITWRSCWDSVFLANPRAVSVGTKTTLWVARAQTSQAILMYCLYYFYWDCLWKVRFLGSLFPGGGTKDDAFLSLINLNKIMTHIKILEPLTGEWTYGIPLTVNIVVADFFTHQKKEKKHFQCLMNISHLLDMQLTFIYLILMNILWGEN